MSDAEKTERMAAVGDYESVLPFQAVGVEPFMLDAESKDVPALFRRLAGEFAVIFVTEEWFECFRTLFDELNDEFPVSIIPIPSQKGSQGLGIENIRSSVERAVGMDIFSVES